MLLNKKLKSIRSVTCILGLCFLTLIFFISIYAYRTSKKSLGVQNITVNAVTDNPLYNKEKSQVMPNPGKNIIKSAYNKIKLKIMPNINLRKFPYPYNSMLAVCSDIDDATLDNFKIYHQFLNTRENTAHGEGLGLDVGDSMWLYMGDNYSNADNVMTYYKGIDINNKHNADEITHFIKSGWIDCLHTFGDFSTDNEEGTLFQRNLAENGWRTLTSIGFSPKVWINHGNRANTQNFGAGNASSFMSYQHGDDPKSNYYHTDITIGNGIRYVWNSLNSNIFGHDFPLTPISLRDGRKVWGFGRYTNVKTNGQIDWVWTPKELHREITRSNLDSIVKNKQYCILAQHFGVNTSDLFTDENLNALYLLKQYQDNNKILIADTTRLLNYAVAQKYIKYNVTIEKGITYINISAINDPIFGTISPEINNLRGITFYTKDPQNTVILINNKAVSTDVVQINPIDDTGKASIGIKWFAPDYTDYTKK